MSSKQTPLAALMASENPAPEKALKPRATSKVWPPLPKVPRQTAMALEEFLTRKYKSKRPPEVSAKVLGLVIELWERDEPFPMREHVAADLNCTKWGIDAALNTAMARELISYKVDTGGSLHTIHRPAVVQHRYFIPSEELVMAAERTSKNASRRSNSH